MLVVVSFLAFSYPSLRILRSTPYSLEFQHSPALVPLNSLELDVLDHIPRRSNARGRDERASCGGVRFDSVGRSFTVELSSKLMAMSASSLAEEDTAHVLDYWTSSRISAGQRREKSGQDVRAWSCGCGH